MAANDDGADDWEWGANSQGRWRWMPWYGPGSEGGRGNSRTSHGQSRETRVANRQNERERLAQQIQTHLTGIQALQGEVARKDQEIEDFTKANGSLTSELNAVKAHAESIRQELHNARAGIRPMLDQLTQLQADKAHLQKEALNASAQLQTLTAQNKDQAKQIQEHGNQLRNMQAGPVSFY